VAYLSIASTRVRRGKPSCFIHRTKFSTSADTPSARGAGRSGELRERDEGEHAPQVAELPLERGGAAKRRTVAKKDGVLALLHRARLADAEPVHDGRWCPQQHSHDSHLSSIAARTIRAERTYVLDARP
jgi:hypothetical protein